MKSLLTKNCPSCGYIQRYKYTGDFNRAVKNKTICKLCTSENQIRQHGPLYLIDIKGCWIWQRHKLKGGYGVWRINGYKSTLAHRVMFQLIKKITIPDNKELDHLCRKRDCVNPDHLEIVTREINQRRGLKSKLTEDQVREIRFIGDSKKQREIAIKFNVSQRLIWNILHNKTWVNI